MKKTIKFYLCLALSCFMCLGFITQASGFSAFSPLDADHWGKEPLPPLTEQLTVNEQKISEVGSTIADSEQHEEAKKEIQKEKTQSVQSVLPDELVCEMISLGNSGYTQAVLHTQANQRVIRQSLEQSANGTKNGFGSQLAGERLQYNTTSFQQNYCPKDASNDGLSQLCSAFTPPDTKALAHLDPSCLMGWQTVDADPANGTASEDCMRFFHYVSSANKPLSLPSPSILSAPGAEQHDDEIMEFYYPLEQQGSLVLDTFSSMHAKTLKGPGTSVSQFRSLLQEIGFSSDEIKFYIPPGGNGLSEMAQLEVISKFMVSNPSFMVRLQTNEENIVRIRTLIQSISLRLDDGMSDMIADKGRHMAALNALLLRDDRERANSGLMVARTE